MRIIKRLKDEDREFVKELVLEYKWLIYSKVREFSNSESDVEDIVQEVAYTMCFHVQKFRDMTKGARVNYIIYIAMTRALNNNDKLARGRNLFYDYCNEKTDKYSDSAEDVFMRKAGKEEINRVLALLPLRDRTVLYGKYIAGLSDMEIAESLGCKPDSIRMMLTRARDKARTKFEKEGIKYERV